MPQIISAMVTACLAVLCLDTIVQVIRTRRWGRSLLFLVAYAAAALCLHVATGYPRGRVAFGGPSLTPLIALMFVCIVMGMAARYGFYFRSRFSWVAFLRPLFVSPLVLLPLLGTLQSDAQLQPVQVISLAILAFQNGFFWRTVFEKAKV